MTVQRDLPQWKNWVAVVKGAINRAATGEEQYTSGGRRRYETQWIQRSKQPAQGDHIRKDHRLHEIEVNPMQHTTTYKQLAPRRVSWATVLTSTLGPERSVEKDKRFFKDEDSNWTTVKHKRRTSIRSHPTNTRLYQRRPHNLIHHRSNFQTKLRCYRCLDKGHMASGCRNARRCLRCDGSGHFAFACTQPLKRTSRSSREHSEQFPHLRGSNNEGQSSFIHALNSGTSVALR